MSDWLVALFAPGAAFGLPSFSGYTTPEQTLSAAGSIVQMQSQQSSAPPANSAVTIAYIVAAVAVLFIIVWGATKVIKAA